MMMIFVMVFSQLNRHPGSATAAAATSLPDPSPAGRGTRRGGGGWHRRRGSGVRVIITGGTMSMSMRSVESSET